jgi:hypothetical protein
MDSFEWPSHKRMRSSGTRARRNTSVRNLRKAWKPTFFVSCSQPSTFRCCSGLPVASRAQGISPWSVHPPAALLFSPRLRLRKKRSTHAVAVDAINTHRRTLATGSSRRSHCSAGYRAHFGNGSRLNDPLVQAIDAAAREIRSGDRGGDAGGAGKRVRDESRSRPAEACPS